jgi:hypothetical protein
MVSLHSGRRGDSEKVPPEGPSPPRRLVQVRVCPVCNRVLLFVQRPPGLRSGRQLGRVEGHAPPLQARPRPGGRTGRVSGCRSCREGRGAGGVTPLASPTAARATSAPAAPAPGPPAAPTSSCPRRSAGGPSARSWRTARGSGGRARGSAGRIRAVRAWFLGEKPPRGRGGGGGGSTECPEKSHRRDTWGHSPTWLSPRGGVPPKVSLRRSCGHHSSPIDQQFLPPPWSAGGSDSSSPANASRPTPRAFARARSVILRGSLILPDSICTTADPVSPALQACRGFSQPSHTPEPPGPTPSCS